MVVEKMHDRVRKFMRIANGQQYNHNYIAAFHLFTALTFHWLS